MINLLNYKTLCCISLLILMGSPDGVLAQDLKDNIDQAIRFMRANQNPDGSYGGEADKLIVTPLVTLSFGTSPRKYTDLDGPFVRRAAEWILSQSEFYMKNEPQKRMDAHALAIAAIASINKFRWKSFLDEGIVKILSSWESQRAAYDKQIQHKLFYGLMALDLYDSKLVEEMKNPNLKADEPIKINESIHYALWLAVHGKALPDEFLQNLVKSLSSPFDKEISNPSKEYETLWIGIYLLAFLNEREKAPEGWVEMIAPCLEERLRNLIADGKKQNLKSIAIMTNALSLCNIKKVGQKPSIALPSQALSPIVEKPRNTEEAISLALDFLKKQQVEGKFGFAGFSDPGITALTLSAVIRTSREIGKEIPSYVKNGLSYLNGLQKEDGSIYEFGLANYVTSASIMAFNDFNNLEYKETVEDAQRFLVALQADEGEGYSIEEDPNYGGMGYGGDERPDLSNTQMSVEALRASGLDPEHEAFKKAILFLQRCQNFSEANPTKVLITPTEKIISGNDGGGIYAPGASKADLEEIDEGIFVARSYGSMTYALLKSYLLAGLKAEDPRVKAAVKWIKTHYSLDENPGFKDIERKELGQQGLYYYYLTMARALSELEIQKIETPDGKTHLWRQELSDKLLRIQREDGSWINHRSSRWFEGNPVLATAYALLVLDLCQEK